MTRIRANRIFATSILLAATTSCERATAGAPPAPAHQYIVGIDISGSRTSAQLQEERQVVDGLVARMTAGDRIILVETYRAGIDSAGQWQDSIPAPREPGVITGRDKRNIEQFRTVASAMAATFFDADASRKVMTTDLFHTLSRAADYAKAANGRRTTVVLLSDMLQSTSDVDFERPGGIPTAQWTDGLKAEGRLPDLRNVCVYVIGPDPSTRTGAKVRDFWRHWFEATGATFRPENYRNMVADPAEIGC